MSEDGGHIEVNDLDDKVSWVRRGGVINTGNVSIGKMVEASNRGIKIDPDADHPDRV